MAARACLVLPAMLLVSAAACWAQEEGAASAAGGAWQIEAPIVTYWAGPGMTDATAKQMAEGGFNLVWCGEGELGVAQRHGLRGMLRDGLLSPATLDDAEKKAALDALIERVRKHPALYSYYIIDEPNASAFPALGRLVAYLRERDPAHFAYINLFPTYARNEQLGTQGDVVTAYGEHLRQYVEIVKPELVSYDHYQFMVGYDRTQYFLNLDMIRRASQDAGVPFLNIVQAASWDASVRAPAPPEMLYLVYTTVAYGAQGISYYVYCHPRHTGGIALADGTPTPIYHALTSLNREFVAIATELQPLRSQGVFHTAMQEAGYEALAEEAAFRIDGASSPEKGRGYLLGYFGKAVEPTHVVVVNVDYQKEATPVVVGPADLQAFDATTRAWSRAGGSNVELHLPPGGGKLLRVAR